MLAILHRPKRNGCPCFPYDDFAKAAGVAEVLVERECEEQYIGRLT
jgi:hypothetical protein